MKQETNPVPVFSIIRPYYPRESEFKEKKKLFFEIFPKKGTTPYSREEAIEILMIFNQLWTEVGTWPPFELEPWAEEIIDSRRKGKRKPEKFTLQEVMADEMDDEESYDRPIWTMDDVAQESMSQ